MVPAAGTLLLKSDYSGKELPNNYTMDKLSLGDLETVTPVLGHLNSVYGYRDHPINGVYQFHGGVDIGGQTGDPTAAFATGTVEYVGKTTPMGSISNWTMEMASNHSMLIVTRSVSVRDSLWLWGRRLRRWAHPVPPLGHTCIWNLNSIKLIWIQFTISRSWKTNAHWKVGSNSALFPHVGVAQLPGPAGAGPAVRVGLLFP